MNKLTFAIGGFVAIALLAASSSVLLVPSFAQSSPLANVISTATTSARFSVTSSTRVLASTTSVLGTSYTRVYASICNANANPVALNLDGDKAANAANGNITVWIAAAAGYDVCYEITDRNAYSGSITASSTDNTATAITVKDYVQ